MTQAILSNTYDNGLVLVAEPMSSVESAAFTLLVPAGCVYDAADRAGLATLTCEMTLRGSGSRDSRRFVEDLDSLGVERAEGVSELHTSYRGATLARNLDQALEIYADLLRRPRFPEDQLEAARLVAIQDLNAIEDEPSQKVMHELAQRHYPAPYGRPSQGTLAGLTAASLADIRNCHARMFRPNGAIVGVAGRIEWPALIDNVGKLLGDWKPVEKAPPAEGQRGERHAHVMHVSNQTQIGIAYDCIPYAHPDFFQLRGAIGVLSGGMSARLFTEVREKRGLCYSVFASLHSLRNRGSVICYAGTSADRAQETLDVMLAELRRMERGIEQHELSRVKARVKSSLIMQQESSSSRSASIAADWYHLGRVRTLDEVGALIDALSCESINDYLKRNAPGDFTVVTLGPKGLASHGESEGF